MTSTDQLLTAAKRLTKLDEEINTLKERLAAKQLQRREVASKLHRLAPVHDYRGRTRGVPKGTPNQQARKLVPKQVREMRKLWATGKYTQSQLGERFDVPQAIVSKIVRRLTYQDVA